MDEIENKPKRGRPKKETQQVDEKSLVYMQYGAGWITGSGIEFSNEHPYQLVPNDEAPFLLKEERFRKASAEEVKDYYSG